MRNEILQGLFQIIGNEPLHAVAIELDKGAQEIGRQHRLAAAAFLFDDDLGQNLLRQVLGRFGVLNDEFLPLFDHFAQIVERDIGRTAGIVEAAVGVFFDNDHVIFLFARAGHRFELLIGNYMGFSIYMHKMVQNDKRLGVTRPKLTHNAAKADAAIARQTGPRPVNLHLFTTACLLSTAALPLACDPQHKERVLKLVQQMARDMTDGLKAYRASSHVAQRPARKVVWEKGSSRLLQATPRANKNAVPVLLVPSLINRADIMDLDVRHSFAAYLGEAGFDVYLLDWGAPGTDEKTFTIDDYITQRLYPCFEQLNRPHLIGYCMGGTMAAGAIAALDDQSNIRSLTLLAAPWDFHAGDRMMPMRMNAFALSAGPVMEQTLRLPVDWIQALFASIDPLFAFNKFRNFARMDPASDEARRFVIVEDWLNNGVDLTAPAANQAMQQWYIENQPFNGVWTLGKSLVDAGNIKVPTHVVAAGSDRLVPSPSALAILAQIDAATKFEPAIGHIGMMASSRAIGTVWEPVTAFLKRTS